MSMFHRIKRRFRRLHRDERGTATLEFAILFPFFITLFLSSVELAMVAFRHSMLERGLDLAVRDVRLGTGQIPQHNDLKEAICNYAGVLPACMSTLRLEMVRVDPRGSITLNQTPDCIDTSEDVQPVRSYINGQENELMILRACVKFNPVFPTSGLGSHMALDGSGMATLVATSAFVQEPR